MCSASCIQTDPSDIFSHPAPPSISAFVRRKFLTRPRWRRPAGPACGTTSHSCRHRCSLQRAEGFSTRWLDIGETARDVVIGAGNPTAVGVRMRGAQGSSIEDIAVFAAPDAFAGVAVVSGSGGAHGNITVVGARISLDARETQPSATISNLRLFNQTCAAILHDPSCSTSRITARWATEFTTIQRLCRRRSTPL